MTYARIQETIEEALRLAEKEKVTGKAITPYLLAKIEQLTRGESLKANIQLVLNNARLAAQVAREMLP